MPKRLLNIHMHRSKSKSEIAVGQQFRWLKAFLYDQKQVPEKHMARKKGEEIERNSRDPRDSRTKMIKGICNVYNVYKNTR